MVFIIPSSFLQIEVKMGKITHFEGCTLSLMAEQINEQLNSFKRAHEIFGLDMAIIVRD